MNSQATQRFVGRLALAIALSSLAAEPASSTQGVLLQSNRIEHNQLRLGSGDGILIATPPNSGSVVAGNTLTGFGEYGIYANAHGASNVGGVTISNNTITGFRTPVSVH